MARKLTTLIVLIILQLSFSAPAKDWVYVVVEGDNIWNISKRFLNDINHFKEIQKLNNIPVAKQLQPGTVLRVPLEWIKNHAAKVNVKSISGESTKISAGQTSPVTTQTIFTLGDELRVAPNATITLVFADNTEVTLSNGVLITFDHLSQYGETGMVDTRVRLLDGKLEVRAEKQTGAGSRLDIQTASAVTSVRGTVFRVGVDKKNKNTPNVSVVEVLEGEVAVSAGDKSVAVKQGYGLKIEKGKELKQPAKLLPAPKIITFTKQVEKTNQAVIWQSVDSAQSYIVQIASDKLFSNIQWQKQQKLTSIILPSLTDGRYHLRISAISNDGVEGLTAPVSFMVNINPKAPELIPVDKMYMSTPKALTWTEVPDVQHFIIQIAKDKLFTQLVIDKQVNSQSFILNSPLALGVYYWRVASLQGKNLLDKGPFSVIESFDYSTKLAPPKLRISSRDNNIEVIWNPLPGNQHIELQTAPTSDFQKIDIPLLDSKTSYRFDLINDDPIYIRAKSVLTQHNISSEWSNYCKVSGKFEICK
ncbi:FecR domain-containing protein [Psychrosphaera sp. F3M07]|uniref:FecR domain-containing protein n=1 Tax=Psychrosphaera sp. F3M07 TaxID=2841560 RepID=UPI001C08FA01|nr:FecR domain-containing protein [Psychrosphaera sp. F3M07]MBU2917954.1 FecR domain-containing protein [Psychrosphaera sp. F3M07]